MIIATMFHPPSATPCYRHAFFQPGRKIAHCSRAALGTVQRLTLCLADCIRTRPEFRGPDVARSTDRAGIAAGPDLDERLGVDRLPQRSGGP
jgi:hypothetical protein